LKQSSTLRKAPKTLALRTFFQKNELPLAYIKPAENQGFRTRQST